MADRRTLTGANDGQTVATTVGASILLELAERPTSGYRWAFAQVDQVLVAVEESPSSGERGRPGARGVAAWTLTMRAPGKTRIELKLWRRWEGDRSITERFAVTLEIKPA